MHMHQVVDNDTSKFAILAVYSHIVRKSTTLTSQVRYYFLLRRKHSNILSIVLFYMIRAVRKEYLELFCICIISEYLSYSF